MEGYRSCYLQHSSSNHRPVRNPHHMNHQQMMSLFAELVVADNTQTGDCDLNINGQLYKYTYHEWQSIYGAIDYLASVYIDEDPFHIFNT